MVWAQPGRRVLSDCRDRPERLAPDAGTKPIGADRVSIASTLKGPWADWTCRSFLFLRSLPLPDPRGSHPHQELLESSSRPHRLGHFTGLGEVSRCSCRPKRWRTPDWANRMQGRIRDSVRRAR